MAALLHYSTLWRLEDRQEIPKTVIFSETQREHTSFSWISHFEYELRFLDNAL
jgi:hypothetical protein